MSAFFTHYLKDMARHIQDIDPELLLDISNKILSIKDTVNKVHIFGNGGSAGIASHVAVDMTKNAGIATTTYHDPGLITCFANDYGYEHWVERAIEFYAQSGDLVILISSSGNSMNMVNGANKAKALGLHTITFSGFGKDNKLRAIGDQNVYIENDQYNIVEMSHNIWLLALVDYIIDQN